MTSLTLQGAPVLVVGAGIMGAGIAQVAAAAGHRVMLFDTRDGAAASARERLAATLDGLVAKGKLAAGQAQATLARIESIAVLQQAGGARLVVEAIVEDLAAKRTLLRQLETVVDADAVLATNTSSISVTALAAGLAQPRRLVGMHFFNPVPLMKLVEVVSGLHTHPDVAAAIFDLASAWGKVPVHARSTPGFIVNRIARPYYAEALALLHEQVATPQMLDACLRAAGFRMGPCELMDLIGHDTNFAVTNSVYEANFYDKRYMPSLVQRELVDGGLLGRKTGRGFYRYPEGVPALPVALHEAPATARADGARRRRRRRLPGTGGHRGAGAAGLGTAARKRQRLDRSGRRRPAPGADRRPPRLCLGRCPWPGRCGRLRPAADAAGGPGTALAYAVADSASESGRTQAPPGWRHWASRRWRWPTHPGSSSPARWRC